ncbi:TetR family transcriptional regulator [Hypnocyclicus thermotrophus]|uniref:TetR family transcriptional regulator n=1 Tax=Hypnocyclicus thermotrophus TaxID=1627895 RepID=A0AA46I6F6_9FUSO|nr:TetR/AcrR family transcriptional regulator [Hypnocyclicus thermotrophus]TDT71592.1 TetR family transcriptional regulator [Hypnocyclicus thermotrophus]
MKVTTRQLIITTFYKLIAKKGYDKASLNDLVKETGLSKGAIYHYFNTKDDIFIATIEFLFESMMRFDFLDIDNITKKNYKLILKNIGNNILNFGQVDPYYSRFQFEFINQAFRIAIVKDYLIKFLQKYLEFFNSFFDHLYKKNIISKKKDHEIIKQLFFMMLDSMVLYKTLDIPFNFEKNWEKFIDLILNEED